MSVDRHLQAAVRPPDGAETVEVTQVVGGLARHDEGRPQRGADPRTGAVTSGVGAVHVDDSVPEHQDAADAGDGGGRDLLVRRRPGQDGGHRGPADGEKARSQNPADQVASLQAGGLGAANGSSR
jgi:hypothetical protein